MDGYRLSRLFWRGVYSFLALPLLLLLLFTFGLTRAKVRATLAGRKGLWARLARQLADRDPARPLYWFHVSSAGEFLQAMPVVERLIADGGQCALTCYSVSGYDWLQRAYRAMPDLIVADYLPLDTRANARRMLDLLRPAALVFVKFDLWPNLIWETRRRGVPQYMISATLHAGSLRIRLGLARSLFATLYAAFEAILAVSEEDRARFLQTCPGHPAVHSTGDTRVDSVLDRVRNLEPPPLPAWLEKRTVVIVGSSWPADEQHILPVLGEALQAFPDLTVMMVPHEVDEPHLRQIEGAFAGVSIQRLSGLDVAGAEPIRVILVDRVGILSALYRFADVAYIGGAFKTGVHNVMEPAAMGVPPVFGPRHGNSPEAIALLSEGGAFTISGGAEFRETLYGLLQDGTAREQAGRRAAAYLERSAGAAQHCFTLIRRQP